ncbi:50S ribosomal protein L21 [Lentisphaera profundi]|uniref:Large ribosomal subunit protein bL21 n=1 Tax=Lentisphaera profundi TaxID=1658616 RepID=A0ABY7VX00_9BACT|nr:50S ribosomal protein L21 [Lentisphaera profundi]WDE98730.1 50S ribosomal protein L21 [Lentisphaera profundi]
MYAIIETGGKQYTVREGDVIRVERLKTAGAAYTFDKVLALGGDDAKFGTPLVEGASVIAEIVNEAKGKKLIVFKKKRRKRYKKTQGHRQWFTEVKITGINA